MFVLGHAIKICSELQKFFIFSSREDLLKELCFFETTFQISQGGNWELGVEHLREHLLGYLEGSKRD